MMKKLLPAMLCAAFCCTTALADDRRDGDGYLEMYLRGDMTDSWSCRDAYRFSRQGDTYTLHLDRLDGEFKISGTDWNFNYGAMADGVGAVTGSVAIDGYSNGANFRAGNLTDVTIHFELGTEFKSPNCIYISVGGREPDIPPVSGLSGTLPVIYINVYNADRSGYDNEIIDRNLAHKNYFAGEYWLDTNGCSWLEELGAETVGSAQEPLPLEIKARGNYTRTAFAKKPFKLKLGAKQTLLGLSKSKHFALLAHADDNFGYLRNFTGFSLGRRIGLPWTPWQQPVEVVINGDYRGLYFLTESIRIEGDRVNITELDDNVSDGALVSGGYLVELDNYDEDNQISLDEKSCVEGQTLDRLRVTWDTPEEYSSLQKRFITEQFTAINDLVGANSDQLWSYLDLDDAVRYYLVEELISHTEAYHGSTYMFRDFGEGQKWHFSPLWDCGNAFNGDIHDFFYNCDPFGNTWIPSMRSNATFNQKLSATWAWFMNNGYNGIIEEIDEYVAHISEAAKADRRRWAGARRPDADGAVDVVDNSDMAARRNSVVNHLNGKIEWLKDCFGDYTQMPSSEPERDNTAAAPLPDYAKPAVGALGDIVTYKDARPEYYNLQGMRVDSPVHGRIYIVVQGAQAYKIKY